MRLHDAGGDRARALRTYHACAAALERDLGVEPSAPTREAYEALLPGAVEAAPERAVFVGRAAERQELTALWREAERGRRSSSSSAARPASASRRLVEERPLSAAHTAALATAEARSYPAEGPLAYGPVAAWLPSRAARRPPPAARPRPPDRTRARAAPSSYRVAAAPCPRASSASGCSTRSYRRASGSSSRCCWSRKTCIGATRRRSGSCTTSCAAGRRRGCWSPRRHGARSSATRPPFRSC